MPWRRLMTTSEPPRQTPGRDPCRVPSSQAKRAALLLTIAAALLLFLGLAGAEGQSRPPSTGDGGSAYPRNGSGVWNPHQADQQHLGMWLRHHENLSPAQQEKALELEPGFNRLAPQTQQRLLGRLDQINRMPPLQRQRTVDRIEALEHLSPDKRQQVRASISAIQTLPPGRQRMVKKAFRDLREYPPEQREAMMSSAQFESRFTPEERGILNNVLSVEPYEPRAVATPMESLQSGK